MYNDIVSLTPYPLNVPGILCDCVAMVTEHSPRVVHRETQHPEGVQVTAPTDVFVEHKLGCHVVEWWLTERRTGRLPTNNLQGTVGQL